MIANIFAMRSHAGAPVVDVPHLDLVDARMLQDLGLSQSEWIEHGAKSAPWEGLVEYLWRTIHCRRVRRIETEPHRPGATAF
jgi:hypothetical protein